MIETELNAPTGPTEIERAPTDAAAPTRPSRVKYEARGLSFTTPEGAAAFEAWRAENRALTLEEALDRIFARQAATAAGAIPAADEVRP